MDHNPKGGGGLTPPHLPMRFIRTKAIKIGLPCRMPTLNEIQFVDWDGAHLLYFLEDAGARDTRETHFMVIEHANKQGGVVPDGYNLLTVKQGKSLFVKQ